MISKELVAKLHEIFTLPLYNDSDRIRVSHVACSMSVEHWEATCTLLTEGYLPSALVIHRAQYESLVRSVWLLHAASDEQIGKLSVELNLESEQAAKNLPSISDMMKALSIKVPPQAFDALQQFKENSWNALNSYAHAGIHPLRRHEQGYPPMLMDNIVRNANGLVIIAAMQAASLTGNQMLMKEIHSWQFEYKACLPPVK